MTTEYKVLITGGDGQLSADLAQVFNNSDTVVLNREALDISRPREVQTALLHYKPDVVINTAALTDVGTIEGAVKHIVGRYLDNAASY